jgi:hypothetical protein
VEKFTGVVQEAGVAVSFRVLPNPRCRTPTPHGTATQDRSARCGPRHRALGRIGEPAAWVAMPETAMNQDDQSSTGENDVGSAGKIAPMKPEANSKPVQDSADGDFRSRILRPNPGHHSASFGRNRAIQAQLGLAIGCKNG